MWQISLSNLFKSCQFFASHVRGRSPKGGWGRGYGYIKSTSVEGKHHLPKPSGIFVFFPITSVSFQGYFKSIFCLFQDGDIKKTAVCTIILMNIIILKKFWVSSFQLRVIPRIFLNRPCATSRLIFAGSKAQSQQRFSCLQVGEIDVKHNVMDPPETSTPVLKQLFCFSNFFVLKKNAQSILWFPENGYLQHNFWLTEQHIASLPSTTNHSLLFDTGSTCEGDNLRKFLDHHDLVNPSKKRYPKAAHARLLDGLARPSWT